MLDPKLAHTVISSGLDKGADFVDVFVEQNVASSLSYLDSQVKDVRSGTDFGVGIRVFFGNKALYGYTNRVDEDELVSIIESLCLNDLSEKKAFLSKNFNPSLSYSQPVEKGLDSEFPLDEKILLLSQLNQFSRKHEKISQMDASILQRWQKVEIFNSEGFHGRDERHYTRLSSTVIAQDGSRQARAYEGPGGTLGAGFLSEIDAEQLSEKLVKRALSVLSAQGCPAGKMPVIIDSGFGGVIFHEACGHLLETTSVEKQASVFHDKMGEMIAHPAVSAVDTGDIAGAWGSIRMDDEGSPTQKTQLIKEGRLESFLVDRMGERKTGYKRTGSARRQSYKFAPASRMRNTYIEAGPHSLDELLASVDRGLYAKVMGGGSVSPGTGDFNFAVEEAYLIENGKISKPVRGATLIGSGPDTLKKISMVGSNFAVAPGMCGSVSGSVPVTVGQPALKVDEILVGGES